MIIRAYMWIVECIVNQARTPCYTELYTKYTKLIALLKLAELIDIKKTVHACTYQQELPHALDALELGDGMKKYGLYPSTHALEIPQQVQHKHTPALAALDK